MLFKKGDIEIQQIILFILGLIVLIALIYIFRSQIAQFLGTLARFGEGTSKAAPSIENIVGK